MKTSTIIPAVFSAMTVLSANGQTNNADQAAIKKVIDQETRAYFTLNYDQWAAAWLHDSSAFRLDVSPGIYSRVNGWSKIDPGKESMKKNGTPYTEEQMKPYTTKSDYHIYINGNAATVFFREGLTPDKTSDEVRTMIKQNGEWKIQGLTVISTAAYHFQNSVEGLRAFIGKWKLVPGSATDQAADSIAHVYSQNVDIHEIINGIEFSWSSSWRYNKNNYAQTETELFFPDYQLNKFRYSDFSRQGDLSTSGFSGVAFFDSTGKFIIHEMYDDVIMVNIQNTYTMKEDGTLHMDGITYDKTGKQTSTWSFDLQRL